MKRLLRSDPVQAAVAWLAALYIRLVFATSRWSVLGAENPGRLLDAGQPLIACFWHGRLLMMTKIWPYRTPMHMLISGHPDGQLIARTILHFGFRVISGSSSKRGARALRAMAQALAQRDCVAVTPDGPRGPRMRAAAGAAMTAKLGHAPILPLTYSSSRAIMLKSWDRFLLPLPFGHCVFIWGEPIMVAEDADAADIEAARAAIEARLNQITAEADRRCGRRPVEPAPAAARLATDPA